MRPLVILGFLVAGLYLGLRWLRRAGPVRAAVALRWAALAASALLLLLLTARGSAAAVAMPLLVLLLPLLLRNWQSLWRPAPSTGHGGGPSGSAAPEGYSTVQTRFLRMSLAHATGEMQGTVLQGRFAGCTLGELSLADLLALWRECQADAQSAAVLEAYLDRTQSADWRQQARRQEEETARESRPRGAAMDRREAYEILGLQPGASAAEIKAAHRRLMQRLHPDHGGSTYLAARINQAKDVLLAD